MPDSDERLEVENLATYHETAYSSASCDEEFVAILALATEQGSTIDILMELLKDMAGYERQHGTNLDECQRCLGQDEDDLSSDLLAWSEAYYRFIALAGLLGVRSCGR